MLNQRSFLGFDNLWFCMTASFLFLFFLKKNTLKWYKGKGATGLWFTLKWFWKRNTEWQKGMGGSERKTENNTAKSKCDKTWQNLGNWGGVDGNFPLSLRVLQNWRESSELERHCWVALAAGTCYCLTLGGLEAGITEVLRERGFSGVLRCLVWMESGMCVCVDTEKGRTLKFSNWGREGNLRKQERKRNTVSASTHDKPLLPLSTSNWSFGQSYKTCELVYEQTGSRCP